MVEIYKTINHLNPAYKSEFFIKKEVSFDLVSINYAGSQS